MSNLTVSQLRCRGEYTNKYVMAGLPDNIPSPIVIPVLDSLASPRLEGFFL